MAAFKIYLPSNACPVLFPQNTATDYRTRFDKPITLDGEWEVGAESISYSSHINDDKERAEVRLFGESTQDVPVNNLYKYQFLLSDDGKWKGYRGITPKLFFESNSSEVQGILNTLNAMNRQMLNPQKLSVNGHIFEFSLNKKNHVEYCGYDNGFTLQLTNSLARVLGFQYHTVLSGKQTIVAKEKPMTSVPLKGDDYLLRYMNTVCQNMEDSITLKDWGKSFDGKQETFLKLWEEKITKVTDTRAEFSSSGKLILHNHSREFGLIFSEGFAKTFKMEEAFFGKGTRWANMKAALKSDHEDEDWCIDVYDLSLDVSFETKKFDHSMSFYPWRCESMKEVITLLNSQVESKLRDVLKDTYNEDEHRFQLSLKENDHAKLVLGTLIKWCHFSKNLSSLMGFPMDVNYEEETHGVREVDSLTNHSRQLHVLSNAIKPTAYGKHQRQILCDFLHQRSNLAIIEKRFDPIS